ncbi:MAG: hypothetical protein P8Y02_13650 [Deinococcales bacterium]|jgi:hypothetical protein
MASSRIRRLLGVVTCGLVLASVAQAAQPMDTNTAYGTMVEQAVRTLGGSPVGCSGLLDSGTPSSEQVLCASVPASMFGYFKMGVHGRLYEYLSRGTLHVARSWASVGNVLRVVYDVQGGTLTVERKRVGGRIYAVFEYKAPAGYASAKAPGSTSSTSSSTASSGAASATSSSGSSSSSTGKSTGSSTGSSSGPSSSSTSSTTASASASGHP